MCIVNRCAQRRVTRINPINPFAPIGLIGKRADQPERFNHCMIKRLLTTGELADELGVISANTIARYVREGRLTPTDVTPGGHFRWDPDDARRQLKALRQAPE